jgi:hypothetical protein
LYPFQINKIRIGTKPLQEGQTYIAGVHLNPGCTLPKYMVKRIKIHDDLYTININYDSLHLIENDSAVKSMEIVRIL